MTGQKQWLEFLANSSSMPLEAEIYNERSGSATAGLHLVTGQAERAQRSQSIHRIQDNMGSGWGDVSVTDILAT